MQGLRQIRLLVVDGWEGERLDMKEKNTIILAILQRSVEKGGY